MQRLEVYQSLWAMERRRPDGAEWTLDQKVRLIHEAGFDGAGVRFGDAAYARDATGLLRERGLRWQAQCYPQTVEELWPIVDRVKQLGGDHVNLQPDVRPLRLEDCIPYLEGWRRIARESGVPVHVETHRNRMTTDLHFMLRLLDCFPDLRLTGDISHYVVGREFAWPISGEDHAQVHRVLDHCWGFHGRVASREQIQLQIGFPQHREWLDLFMGWWAYGFRSWRRRAPKDAVLTFLCELGPREYAMTGPDGYELSDRFEEAKLLMRLVRELWQRIETEEPPGGDTP